MADNGNHSAETTGAGLLRFLDFAIEKGHLKSSTGQAMKTACREVLSTAEGDSWETADLTTLDVDDVCRRFETLRAMKFSAGSLSTYKGRFQKSLTMFEEFRSNPSSWRPTVKQRVRAKAAAPGEHPRPGDSVVDVPRAHMAHLSPGVITYPFPLRDGVLVSLQLPADLSKREARRLGTFIDSLAIEEQPALPSAAEESARP